MQDLITQFRQDVIVSASDPKFIHSPWYVKYHLEIVEKIALELCQIYQDADRHLVLTLVWLHDYGKIMNASLQSTITEGREKLGQIGFHESFIDKAVLYAEYIDQQRDLDKKPIEVQIVSSADGASHLIGPFQFLWWQENHQKPFTALMADNIKKISKDWEKKIVLPEVRQSFSKRREYMLELSGHFPERFITAASNTH